MNARMAPLRSSSKQTEPIRDEVEIKAENGPKKAAAFYQSDLEIRKGRESKFKGRRLETSKHKVLAFHVNAPSVTL